MSWFKSRGSSATTSSKSWGSSWGSGYSWDSFRKKDDDSNLIISKPEGYLTPTSSEIQDKLEFGNRYTGFYAKKDKVTKDEVEFVKNFSNFFYHHMLDVKPEDTFIEEYQGEKLTQRSPEELAKYENYKKSFDSVSEVKVPFYTPLEKSIFFLEVLREMAKEQNKSMEDMMKDLANQMQNMKIDEDTLNNKNTNEILDRMLGDYEESEDDGESDEDTLNDLFGDKDGEGQGEGEGEDGEDGEGEGQGSGEGKDGEGKDGKGKSNNKLNNNNNGGNRQEKPTKQKGGNRGGDSTPENIFKGVLESWGRYNDGNRFVNKSELLKKISRISGFGDEFAIEKQVISKATHNSREKRNVRMSSIDQVANVDIVQRILPNYNMRLALQDLRVNVPVKTTEEKQKIIILIDRSGSMHSGNKGKWIMAFLADRLKAVMEDEAEIFVSNFEYYTKDLRFFHAWDRESAIKLMKEYSWYPSGGDTNVGEMIQYIADEINEKRKLHNLNVDLSREKVEILVINDGQDSVKTDNLPWKTNALTLCDGINNELKKLCLKTEGKYIFIDNKDEVHEFSNT